MPSVPASTPSALPSAPPALSSILIGSFSAWQPPLMEPADDWCDYCWVQPKGPENPFELVNFIITTTQNIQYMFDGPSIFVYLNYYKDQF